VIKRSGKRTPLKNITLEKDKIRGPMVRLLWRGGALAERPNRFFWLIEVFLSFFFSSFIFEDQTKSLDEADD